MFAGSRVLRKAANESTRDEDALPLMTANPPACNHPVSKTEFFNDYWEALARENWSAVILHSWRNLPEAIESDIDYAVKGPTARELLRFLADYSRAKGWLLVQVIEHEPGAFFCVCMQRGFPFSYVELDVTWNYRRIGHRLLDSAFLFSESRRIPGKTFETTSAGVEFTYLLAKAAAKGNDLAKIRGRLAELLEEEPEGCRQCVIRAFSDAPPPAGGECLSAWSSWFANAPCFKAVRSGRKLGLGEILLYLRRMLNPTGFFISTRGNPTDEPVLRLSKALAPAFRHAEVRGPLRIQDRLALLPRLIRTTLVIEATGKPGDSSGTHQDPDGNGGVVMALDALAARIDRRISTC